MKEKKHRILITITNTKKNLLMCEDEGERRRKEKAIRQLEKAVRKIDKRIYSTHESIEYVVKELTKREEKLNALKQAYEILVDEYMSMYY